MTTISDYLNLSWMTVGRGFGRNSYFSLKVLNRKRIKYRYVTKFTTNWDDAIAFQSHDYAVLINRLLVTHQTSGKSDEHCQVSWGNLS